MPETASDAELLAGAAIALNRHADILRALGAVFADAGHELYLVGGSVRDAILGRLGADLDFATDAAARSKCSNMLRHWADALWDTGIQFGTVGAAQGRAPLEITTYRSDTYDQVSRNPQVRFGTEHRRGSGAPRLHGQRDGRAHYRRRPGGVRRPARRAGRDPSAGTGHPGST